MASRHLGMDELNRTALEHFVYQPVNRDMIAYLAEAAHNVIACDSCLMPAAAAPPKTQGPTPPHSPEPQLVGTEEAPLPTVEEFITQLVVSSNVQVPTLMSTLVYLARLKSRLQPMARGLRCTTHRIFLATLILSAKYLNDSSPKNKHWAKYSHLDTDGCAFGFNRTEVNLMEKQLLFLLEWDLRITEQDLYRELEPFLEPLRRKIAQRHERKMRQREEKEVYRELLAHADRYPSPASSRRSPSHRESADQAHPLRGDATSPGLSSGSSASSYTPSIASSRHYSRATTPLDRAPEPYLVDASQPGSLYDSPVEVVMEPDVSKVQIPAASLLPYEISVEDHYQRACDEAPKRRPKRGMWERLLGSAVAVR